MHLNKRGVALLQVLIIAAVLAGLSTMILRAVMARSSSARSIRQTVTAQMVVEDCMNRVNDYWMDRFEQDPKGAAEDLEKCVFRQEGETYELSHGGRLAALRTFECYLPFEGSANGRIAVHAHFVRYYEDHDRRSSWNDEGGNLVGMEDDRCALEYKIIGGANRL